MKTLFKILAVSALVAACPAVLARDRGGQWGNLGGFHSGRAAHFVGRSPSRGYFAPRYADYGGGNRAYTGFGYRSWGWPYDTRYYSWGWPYYAYSYGPDYYPRHLSYDSGYSMAADVQAALANLGFYHGAIDGIAGPMTRDAIRNYQASNGLPVTGLIDKRLIDALGFG